MIRFRALLPANHNLDTYAPGALLPDPRGWPTFRAMLHHGVITYEMVDADGVVTPRRWSPNYPMKVGTETVNTAQMLPADVETWSVWPLLKKSVHPAENIMAEPYWTAAGPVPIPAAPRAAVEEPAPMTPEEIQKVNMALYGVPALVHPVPDEDDLKARYPYGPPREDVQLVPSAPVNGVFAPDTRPPSALPKRDFEPSTPVEQPFGKPAPVVQPPELRLTEQKPTMAEPAHEGVPARAATPEKPRMDLKALAGKLGGGKNSKKGAPRGA